MTTSKARPLQRGVWSTILERYIPEAGFFVNIGACDGVSNDPIYPFIETRRLRGIAVEPVPHLCERLRKNMQAFPSVICERLAIDTKTRSAVFYHAPEHFQSVRGFGDQIGSLSSTRVNDTIDRVHFLLGAPDASTKGEMVTSEVQCLTFDDLMRRHAVEKVDFINIDAEGFDFEIFRSIDLAIWKPAVICIESRPFNQAQRREMFRRLTEHGYAFLMALDIFSEVYVRTDAERAVTASVTTAAMAGLHRPMVLRAPHEIDGLHFVSSHCDETYTSIIAAERLHRTSASSSSHVNGRPWPAFVSALLNRQLTGDASISVWDDIAKRGPYGKVALVGATGSSHPCRWLEQGHVGSLDVYDFSPELLEHTRRRAEELSVGERVRTFELDLNLEPLKGGSYDLVLTYFFLNHLVELEWVLASIGAALRADGLVALYEYTAERRQRYGSAREELVGEILRLVPEDDVHPPPTTSTMQACRSDELMVLATNALEPLYEASGGAAAPVLDRLNLERVAGGGPEAERALLAALENAEARATVPGTVTYAVFRKTTERSG